MRKFFIIPLLLCFLHVQGQDVIIKSGSDKWKTVYRGEAEKVNDLVHTKLDVRFDLEKAYMYGKAWITLQPHFYPTDSLTLDAKGMDIHEVSLISGNNKKSLQYIYDSLQLHINLGRKISGGEKYNIYIEYTAKPNEYKGKGSAAISDAKGLYFINPTGEDKNKPTQIWTQGETEANSVWMPTIDKPNQKTTEEIAMTVPSKFVTLSNGLLVNQKKNADGTRTDFWKMDLPHAPYLFFMGVGDYTIIKDAYKGKEVSYYVEKEYAPFARKIFGNTPEMLKFFSEKTGVEYVWPKYAQIVGRDFVSGAMENTTATLHGEGAYQDARELVDENGWEDVIAHELFHHWFGDLVTAESWSNITVNESFADYSETLWNEYKYGKDAGDRINYNAMQSYLYGAAEDKQLVRFYYKDKEDVFDVVSYQKGGRILHMLRNYVGDEAFFASLKKYLTDNKFKTGEAQQLRLAFESVTGKDLNWFWNQWYYGKGHPVLNIDYRYNDADKLATVIVKQMQDSGNIFKLPIAIDVYNNTKKERYNVWLQNAVDSFSFKYENRPTLINVDAEKVILAEKTDNKTRENFIAQYTNAGKFTDRLEALIYFSKNNLHKDLGIGLTDSFFRIRRFTLSQLAEDSAALADKAIITKVEDLANNDKSTLVQAEALSFLAATQNPAYASLFKSHLNDSSYSVSGAALKGFAQINSESAYDFAKKYLNAKGVLGAAALEVIMVNGTLEDYDLLTQHYKKMRTGQSKFNQTPVFAAYLSRLENTEKIKSGIDLIVAFRNEIPEAYRNFTDKTFTEALQIIADKHPGPIAEYAGNAIRD